MPTITATAQGKPSVTHFEFSIDLVSSDVWIRPVSTTIPAPSLKPTIAVAMENSGIGIWLSDDLAGSIKEVKPYMKFRARRLKFTFSNCDWNYNKAICLQYSENITGQRFKRLIGYSVPGNYSEF